MIMIEEDKYLCKHDWKDMYGGDGSDKDNPYKAYQAFYCQKCLEIRVKSWSRLRYKLSEEFLEEFENNGEAGVEA